MHAGATHTLLYVLYGFVLTLVDRLPGVYGRKNTRCTLNHGPCFKSLKVHSRMKLLYKILNQCNWYRFDPAIEQSRAVANPPPRPRF